MDRGEIDQIVNKMIAEKEVFEDSLVSCSTTLAACNKPPLDSNRLIIKVLFILRMKYFRPTPCHPEPVVLERRLKIMTKSVTIDRRFHQRLPSFESHIVGFFAHCRQALTINEMMPFHNGNCQSIDVHADLHNTGLKHGDIIYVDADLWFDLSKMPYLVRS